MKNQVTIDEWIDALRSGDYIQGDGMLQDDDGRFCCLGVLCDLIDDTKWDTDYDDWEDWNWDGAPNMMIPRILSDNIKGCRPNCDIEVDLANANDNGYTFDEIADYLEAIKPLIVRR